MLKQYKLKDYNFRLVLWLIAISSMGVLLVGSAQISLQRRQLTGVIMGLILMVILSLMDFSWILNFYWILYVANIIMLVVLIFVGKTTSGATRWIDLGFTQFQPTELAKIILILFFAKYLMDHEEEINTFKLLVKSVCLLALPLILIYRQPDMKNTVTVLILFCIMLYIAGLSYKIIGGALLIAIPLIVIFLVIVIQPDQNLIKDYQRNRIMAFFYPENEEYVDDNTQQENSITAIGSGQLAGKGLNNNEVSSANKGNYVSQIQTDFIFAVAGEELGFVGSVCIIGLLMLIVFECILTGRRAKDLSGQIICCGVGALVGIQSFINICVATGLMPNTGTPLPFVSYGLSSLITLYIGMGLVLNIGLQKSKSYAGG